LLRKAAYGGRVYLPCALLFSSPEVNSDCGFHLGNYLPPKKGRQAKPALRSKVMNNLFPKPFRCLKITLSTVYNHRFTGGYIDFSAEILFL